MKEIPILFSGQMVRAILEGRKTQTRRVVKGLPEHAFEIGYWDQMGAPHRAKSGLYWHQPAEQGTSFSTKMMPCPYGQPGDRLWVRETWWHQKGLYLEQAGFEGGTIGRLEDGNGGRFNSNKDFIPANHGKLWRKRPSIHMPRWASRITLEVTEVRVQRLQEISGNDAEAEGISFDGNASPESYDPRDQFQNLWDSINGKRPGCAWKDNPWIWAVSFKKVKP